MSLIKIVNKHLKRQGNLVSKISKFGVIGINLYGALGHSIHIDSLDNFIKVSEGESVTFDKSRKIYEDHDLASFENNNVKYFVLLERQETKELEELLNE